MITVYNANNIAQQWYFKKAFAILAGKGVLSDKELEMERFLSVDDYFAHMGDLIKINPVYAMLPTDEEPFVIDANARTITIPAGFNKCAGVAGDNMCEIATFTVDRYFDYVDLDKTNICIQWSTKNGQEGISHVTLRDIDSIPGKMRFGWPLTSLITAEPGTVNFAVKFFIEDEEGKVKYILNTLKASIVIREGLQLKEGALEESNNDLFASFVKNSTNPSYPVPKPVSWGAPGLDLYPMKKVAEAQTVNKDGVIEDENTFILRAQAIVEDNGHLVYNWYFKSDNEGSEVENISLLENDPRFQIRDVYVPVEPAPQKRKGAEQYFVEKEGTPSGYEIYIDALPAEVPVFERFTELMVKDSTEQNITGVYYVGASNYNGVNHVALGTDEDGNVVKIEAQNHTSEMQSSECKVLGPIDVDFEDNLDDDKFLVENKAQLKVQTKRDSGEPLLDYDWYYSDEEIVEIEFDDNGVPVNQDDMMADKNGPIMTAENAGWYFVQVKSKLNRKEKSNVSNICRVVNDPEKASLVNMKYSKILDSSYSRLTDAERAEYLETKSQWNYLIENSEKKEGAETAMDDIANAQGEMFRLQIDTNLDVTKPSKLVSDEVQYKWYVIMPDESARPIEESDAAADNNGLVLYGCPTDKNYLDIRCIRNGDKYHYYCEVTNKLVDKTATFGHGDYNNVIFHIW